MEHRSTLPAVLTNAVLVVPALSIGEIAGAAVDAGFRADLADGARAWLASGSTTGMVAVLALSLLIGAVAGIVSMGITAMIFRTANYQIVAYSVSCIYVTLYAVVAILVLATTRVDLTIVSALTAIAGMVAGLFWVSRRISAGQANRYASAR